MTLTDFQLSLLSFCKDRLVKYIDSTLGRVAFLGLVGCLNFNFEAVLHKTMPHLTTLGLIDKDGNVNVDLLDKVGFSGDIFGAVKEAKVNVEMISEGASDVSLNFVVPAESATDVIKILHKKYVKKEGA